MLNGLVAGSEDHKRGFSRIVQLLVWLVIVPTTLLLAMGVLMLVLGETRLNLLFGILVITLVGCLITGVVLSLVFLRREANLSKLQLDFVSKVSHEPRTPLTSIRMFVDMLQQDGERTDEETALCLSVLQKETSRLSERIERLLDWGRMEAGRRIYDHRPDTPAAIIESALEAFGANQVGRSPDVAVEIDDDLPTVLADREALVDALVNLLTNAVKYSNDEPEITVLATADARQVRISVRDQGIGIPRREHSRIFQKFYRVDDLLKRDLEGTGLGLAIVRHVASGHRGHVEVDSEPGHGSTFTIVLPRASKQSVTESRERQVPVGAAKQTP